MLPSSIIIISYIIDEVIASLIEAINSGIDSSSLYAGITIDKSIYKFSLIIKF